MGEQSEMIKCDRQDCQNEGAYHPVLLLYAPRKYNINDPIKSILSINVCEEHVKEDKLENFLSNEGWIQLCEAIASIGKVLPERSRTQLSWMKIKN